ncbi:MAG TPA: 2-oxoacid:acceptor oxidoreductase family protein [Solirubrobacteraceae bacterium]|nr:2-oxoacid:acceptor oxidoreductase family protein [Solirubrobacteraceae bacterium]
MFEIRIHGRGGQGVVTAAELLSVAAFDEGRHAQAFPSFGSERTGAPVVAFCRIGDRPIRTREPIADPGGLIIGDPTLLHQVDVFGGLRPDGYVLINTSRELGELDLGDVLRRHDAERWRTVAATELARAHLGRPLPNAALLGGFAALTGAVGIEAVTAAIRERFPGPTGEANAAAALDAHRRLRAPRALLGTSRA